jgi:DNA (cytosine-5)-methyltransferase 1
MLKSSQPNRELIVDCFAGGGGTSLGIEMAGLNVDIAINHDLDAIEMHKANHPDTLHFCENIWQVDPVIATMGRPVALAWFSPDCTDFSKAKGRTPVRKNIRGLAWVVVKWARAVRPRVIILENVEEFRQWGPTVKKRVHIRQMCFDAVMPKNYKFVEYPDPAKRGMTFKLWENCLRGLGYELEWRELVAADYGAPTLRKRLFIIARCDGQPIVWPKKTHGPGLLPYRTAAECIDWSLPCPSIFERKKPLAENTLRRIALGIQKYVIESKEPFIIRTGHYSNITGKGDTFRGQGVDRPLGTVCSVNDKALVVPTLVCNTTNNPPTSPSDPLKTVTTGNHHYLAAASLMKIGQTGGNGHRINSPAEPLRTVVSKNEDCLVTASLSKYFGGAGGADIKKPMPTVTAIDHNGLVTAHLTKYHGLKGEECRGQNLDKPAATLDTSNRFGVVSTFLTKFYGTNVGSDMREPVPTVTATGQHIGEVRAFLIKYYHTGIGQPLKKPLHTITTKHRLGLVTVAGQEYQIADIGLRMLTPRELTRAQGFTDAYKLTGSKKNQVAKIGNSVCPPVACALVKANVEIKEIQEAKTG